MLRTTQQDLTFAPADDLDDVAGVSPRVLRMGLISCYSGVATGEKIRHCQVEEDRQKSCSPHP